MHDSGNTEDNYAPIACGLYDHLEVFAIQRKVIDIKYNNLGSEVKLEDVMIESTIIRDGEEYLKLVSGEEIRLDKLLAIDDLVFNN